MADDATGDEQSISFNIKTAGDQKFTVSVPLSMTVQSLKELLSSDSYASIPPERQRLIYSGRVLKDGDALATYKIKEGNTVHLVKGAESNTRNQPNASGSSTVPGAGSASTPALPNMAAGTGANNLLAGLTGARFAGLAQLPNQSMFGPDGGMGPPPDPEEQLRMLDDPATRAQMNEMLSNPAVIDEMIRRNPMLSNMPGARQMLQSPMFRQMMTDPEYLGRMVQMQRAMRGQRQGTQNSFQAPGGVEGGEGQATGTTGQAQGQGEQQPGHGMPANPFASIFSGAGTGGMGNMGDNPFAALVNSGMFAGTTGAGAAGAGTTPGAGGEGQTGDAANNPTGSPGAQNPFASLLAGAIANNPIVQNMTRNLMQNPELLSQLMDARFGPLGGGQGGQQGQGQEGQQGQPGQPPVNPFAAPFHGMGGGMEGAGAANPFGGFGGFGDLPAASADNRPPEERYADQLRQLNDMGFYDFDQNVTALRRSGGSVQGAVNHLLGA